MDTFFLSRFGKVYFASYNKEALMDHARNAAHAIAVSNGAQAVVVNSAWYEKPWNYVEPEASPFTIELVGYAVATGVLFDGAPHFLPYVTSVVKMTDEEKVPYYMFELGVGYGG